MKIAIATQNHGRQVSSPLCKLRGLPAGAELRVTSAHCAKTFRSTFH